MATRDIVQEILEKEFEELTRCKELMKPAKAINPEDCRSFTWNRFMTVYTKRAPFLIKLFRELVFKNQNGKDDPENNENEEEIENERANMDPEEYTEYIGLKNKRRFKNRDLMISAAVSILLFGRSQKINAFQTFMGMYLEVTPLVPLILNSE
ncbi:hypothetical protein BDZ91DRAFT_555456 [Kalaharituber pfeilii]|nr:hypothetical protein BDZ91DRAFT_555456 [Kalaharituber pfeilii]